MNDKHSLGYWLHEKILGDYVINDLRKNMPKSQPNLFQRIEELEAKVAKLETALQMFMLSQSMKNMV